MRLVAEAAPELGDHPPGAATQRLHRMLGDALPGARLVRSDDVGISADGKEALAFAVLAYLTLNGKPGNVPGATGARGRVVLGKIVPGMGSTLNT